MTMSNATTSLQPDAVKAVEEFSRIVAALQLRPTPPAPTGLKATALGATKVNLEWEHNSLNEKEFKIERCEGPNCAEFAEIKRVPKGVKKHEDASAYGGKIYRYRVRASNGNGDSSSSNIVEATTPNTTP
jgi:hypothetical protein